MAMTNVHIVLSWFEKDPDIHTVTIFTPNRNDAKRRIRVTRIGKPSRRSQDYRVTIGPPNYAEREFLKDCRRAKCHPKQYLLKNYPKGSRKI